jgi:hypothetical protein
MSSVKIEKTSDQTATLTFSVCRLGSFLTEGRSNKIKINITDSDELRLISANLNHLKNTKYQGLLTVNFSEGQKYQLDQSIWHALAAALLAFALCVDCAKLGI